MKKDNKSASIATDALMQFMQQIHKVGQDARDKQKPMPAIVAEGYKITTNGVFRKLRDSVVCDIVVTFDKQKVSKDLTLAQIAFRLQRVRDAYMKVLQDNKFVPSFTIKDFVQLTIKIPYVY